MMQPLIYHATRLQLVHTRQGALRCWAFGRTDEDSPEVMVGQLRAPDLENPPKSGLLRLFAGTYQRGQAVYEEDAALLVPPGGLDAVVRWFPLAMASKAPHSLVL